ncbi:MAG: C4-type zinc ribbon domain-containing protein [Candidatus Omnitrophica bacterium]|nr:C4-type zinc ribbon domain-containing protein [Candidatus Omnitrophota bacterium]
MKAELDNLGPQRQLLRAKTARAQSDLEAARSKFQQLETERKNAELEVDGKKQFIAKYSLQQFQTKKNEEYRALAHEIELCQNAISKLEDRQLELMEQQDVVQKEVAQTARTAAGMKKEVETQLAHLDERETELQKMLGDLNTGREQLAEVVENSTRTRYERLLKHKGEKVIVGIDHGVCGGCHMTLPPQVLVTCQGDQEIMSCPNCGRILYYSPEMDLAPNSQ